MTENKAKKLLILSVTAGQGHIKTSEALLSAWEAENNEGVILDTLEYVEPLMGDSVDKGYLMSTKYVPKLYGAVYSLLDKKTEKSLPLFTSKAIRKKMEEYILSYRPDAIVCPHVIPAAIISELDSDLIKTIPTVGIITDFTVHPYWQTCRLDHYVLPHPLLLHQCEKKGLPKESILPIGIPVAKPFSEKLPQEEARQRLGILENKPTILVMAGSMGFGNLGDVVTSLDMLPLDFQMLVVTGNNHQAYEKIKANTWKHEIYVYGYVKNVHEMMDASDVIVTKPGGLTVSESMAKKLPMILVNPIPGQEERNYEFLVNNGVAVGTSETFPLDEAVYEFMENHRRKQILPQLLEDFGKPHAAQDLVHFILEQTRRIKGGENQH